MIAALLLVALALAVVTIRQRRLKKKRRQQWLKKRIYLPKSAVDEKFWDMIDRYGDDGYGK